VTLQPFPISGTTKIEPTILSPTGADLSKLDADAVRATQRLIARGFEAYLVGGCVRDLLLGRTPKDYDIATEARPPQVKRTFPRNCRIIGRRFKLAHLHFHNNTKILECSTFRRTPQLENSDEDLLITRDNEFGNAEEDALRRDFTVNALFLDPTRNCILDYTDGLTDLHNRVIRTIGDPRVRFREDPVRILRAAKFAGRLGFSIEPQTFAAMAEAAGEIVRAAPPRLLEEILRLLRGGHALDSFQLLRDVGALRWLVPVLADFLQAARHDQRVEFWRLLEALDQRVLAGRVPPAPVLLGALLVCPVSAMTELNPGRSASSIAEELLGPLSSTLRLPRRDAGCLKRICGVQHRFTQTDENKRFRTAGFVQGPYFDEAFELFELRMFALGQDADAVERWREIASGIGRHAPVDEHAPLDDDARSEHADAKPTIEGDGEDADAPAGAADSSDTIPSEMPPPTNGDSGDGPCRCGRLVRHDPVRDAAANQRRQRRWPDATPSASPPQGQAWARRRPRRGQARGPSSGDPSRRDGAAREPAARGPVARRSRPRRGAPARRERSVRRE
jgi:poly(A) polymerase